MSPRIPVIFWSSSALAILFSAVSAVAQDGPVLETDRPALFSELIECRKIENIEERVACYDAKVDALDQAEANNQVIIADREEVQEARRGLFGFNLPKLRLFGDGDDNEEETISELTTAVVSARQFGRGRWRIRMMDGSVWEQVNTRSLSSRPKEGQEVSIKRASLGSFLVKVGRNPTIRMRRVE